MVRKNSAAAYQHGQATGTLSRREAQVLGAYRDAGRPLTDRQVGQILGFADLNAVKPAITHLLHLKALREVGDVTDPTTGRTVRTAVLAEAEDVQSQLFERNN